MSGESVICVTCGVERAAPVDPCPICADERQYIGADGQRYTSLTELAGAGHHIRVTGLEPGLAGVTVEPKVGIGQQAHLVSTPQGSVLWDPPGYVDEAGAAAVRTHGEVLAITSSHPHMFGAQVDWSRALGGVPVLVAEPQLQWVGRPDPAIEGWSGRRELAPGLTLHEVGGHFPGSSVLHWAAGAGDRGVLFVSDTIHVNPDRATTTFLRSYPNRIPLSPAVVLRIARAVGALTFDRVYDNFGRTIDRDASAAIRHSADRYVGWVSGEFDGLT